MRRVVVTGLGAVTPLGVGVRRTWSRLIAGECGIVSTRPLGEEFTKLPSQVAGLVPRGKLADGAWDASEHVTKDEAHKTALFTQYALAASSEALSSANWHPQPPSHETGICLGSGIGNLSTLYDTSTAYASKGYRGIHPLFVPRLLLNLGAGMISMRYGFTGPNHTASTACTTGAHSIGDAFRFIQSRSADIMLAGSSESCIHALALGGFARSRSLSTSFNDHPELSSRPFSPSRDGFVIAEGAGMLVLEDLSHALARDAPIFAELVGYGVSSDAFHLTAPRPDGDGALRAMDMALREAGVEPKEVDYINAHATSTMLGDVAENQAIKTLMGDGRKGKDVNVSSTKGAVGHLLGAAGSVEALFAVLAIREGVLPPTINMDGDNMEKEEDGDGETEFDLNYVPNVKQDMKVDVALSNSFGFGGTNACLCFRRFKG